VTKTQEKSVATTISDSGKALSKQKQALLKKLEEEDKKKQEQSKEASTAATTALKDPTSLMSDKDKQTYEVLKRLLDMLNQARESIRKGKLPTSGLWDITYSGLNDKFLSSKDSQSANIPNLSLSTGRVGATKTIWSVEKTVSSFVSEEEAVNFSATGMVQTSDGRQISFNVDLELSRAFMEYSQMTDNYTETQIMTDPLVINMDVASAQVSDQKFRFDLDADGTIDEISYLGSGSGFLALDKNGDGKINDGNELFGARTGDGFRELSVYDGDGNGWIDEADEVYSKLKVWVKNDDGTDRLLSLKEANVGAIYLGSASTEYSLTDRTTEEAKAQIRKTGVYLKETGQAGTIQHVDFAI
jgi:hypothetical protein